jgi:hypothetical protein
MRDVRTSAESPALTEAHGGVEASTAPQKRLTVDATVFSELVESLREPSGAPPPEPLRAVLTAIRDALADHPRVVVAITGLESPESDPVQERRELNALIEQMTPELAVPSEAKVSQARRNAEARTQLLQEFGALTGDQVGEEHSKARNRHALAARWRKEGRMFGVPHRRQMLYPAFQFDPGSGELRPVIREVLAALPRDRMSDWEIALWWVAANGWLGGRRPVDVLDDEPHALVAAAEHLGAPSPL